MPNSVAIVIATSRPSRVSLARYTSPIPPAPRGAIISYGPNLVPAGRVIARDYTGAFPVSGIWANLVRRSPGATWI
jgi:hypothetical protein